MNQKFEKLKTLLKELFQLDQPDLDFGLYRVMHAKSAEVTQFLERDLLPQVKEAFAQYEPADKAALQGDLDEAIKQARSLGADPESLPKVQELRAKLADGTVDLSALESEVYDHLYSFFRRYYTDGDFLAKRVYKPGVYAIPYEGEEVILHWANKDQYYIKTTEYLRDYAFRLRPEDDADPMRVHLRLIHAAEGEHGSAKAAEGKERAFILAVTREDEHDFLVEENGELSVRFVYRHATLLDWPESDRVGKTKPPSQKELNAIAVGRVLGAKTPSLASWLAELRRGAPTEREPARTVFERHLQHYTARNTFDCFIHKDLGAFLQRELDFYLKNEVMHLDDVEQSSAAKVQQYLSKLRVIRRVATKFIAFLAQLEEFQKKLWLKKKFVVETRYCVTLDRVPEHLLAAVVDNAGQWSEWDDLYDVSEIDGFARTMGFLKTQPHLVLDTKHFSPSFTSQLVAGLDGVDASLDAILVHSDNFQATRFLMSRYRSAIDVVYNDPPYNTDASAILYKNGYRNSSWCSLMEPLTTACHSLLSDAGILCTTIDDEQVVELTTIIRSAFGPENMLGTVCVRSNPSGRITLRGVAQCHEYAIFASKTKEGKLAKLPRTEEQQARFDQKDDQGAFEWRNFRRDGSSSTRKDRPKQFFPLFVTKTSVRIPEVRWDDTRKEYETLEKPAADEEVLWPIDSSNDERCWRWGIETARAQLQELAVKTNPQGRTQVYNKYRPNEEGILPLTVWVDKKYSATEYGTAVVKSLFGLRAPFDFPKSLFATKDCVHVASIGEAGTVLDCFGGSGTTGHAVLALNREDGGRRKCILVELGAHFDSVLVPRMKKVVYAPEWRDGKVKERDRGVSYAFKLLRLESYEDALNNLTVQRSAAQQSLLGMGDRQANARMREDYVLRYMLEVETRGSPSLLSTQRFADPTSYTMRAKRPGSDESWDANVDLVETFNWLLGLTVRHVAVPECFDATVDRDSEGRLRLSARLRQDPKGPWWFRTVVGTMPNGERTLIIWRKRPGAETPEGVERDNVVLDEWFQKQGYSSKDSEFDLIYVNGDNNLENLKTAGDTWKVRLIEEDFHRLMFDTEGA